MSAKLSILSVSLLALLLAACGPDTQTDPALSQNDSLNDTNSLSPRNTVQSGVIIPVEPTRINAAQIAAAKARLPHQYDAHEPLSLLDLNTNLNPASNR